MVNMVVDGGTCEHGLESTIISLATPVPTILRYGAITLEQLRTVIPSLAEPPRKLISTGDHAILPSPGNMPVHYSPMTPICLIDQLQLVIDYLDSRSRSHRRVGRIYLSEAGRSLDKDIAMKFLVSSRLSETGDLMTVAHSLYETLRTFDKMELDLIVIDSCEEIGLGISIMDRLRRASARLFESGIPTGGRERTSLLVARL